MAEQDPQEMYENLCTFMQTAPPEIQAAFALNEKCQAQTLDIHLKERKRNKALLATLLRCQELFEKALPKFNWGASFLNAEAISLLNDVPIEVAQAIASMKK